MIIKSAEFVTSVANAANILREDVPEIAVAGKSNVGKSSFINFLVNNGKLAKTSKLPGRTRLINYFRVNRGEMMLVDLPGYGFAKVSFDEKQKWGALIEGYLQNSPAIKNLFLLVDIRHEPTADDRMMLNYLYHYNIPYTIIATKADKLSRAQQDRRRQEIANSLMVGKENIYVVSSLKKTGKERILERLDSILTPVDLGE